MPQGNPLPGERYIHFKNKMYQVLTIAYHSETQEKMVIYQAMYGDFKAYARPYDMFISPVDREKYPEAEQQFRFQYAGSIADERTFKEEEPEVLQTEKEPMQESEEINPWLERVLDADTFGKKYQTVCEIRGDITDRLIDDLAVVMDLTIPQGDLSERYEQLKYCMRTRQRYESGHLRE